MTEEPKKSKLRELYAYKAKLLEELDQLTKQKEGVDSAIERLNGKLSGVLKNIEHIEGRELLITTHFVERYRQRVGPRSMQEEHIRAHIVTPELLNMIATLGNGVYPVMDMPGFTVVVQDNKLVTINCPMPKEKPIYKKIKKQGRERPRKYK
jgi:hypothetical protein